MGEEFQTTWSCFFQGQWCWTKSYCIFFFFSPESLVCSQRSPQKLGPQHQQEQAHLDHCATRRGVRARNTTELARHCTPLPSIFSIGVGDRISIERKDFFCTQRRRSRSDQLAGPTVTGWEAEVHARDRHHVKSGFLLRSWVRSRLSCSLFSWKKGKKEKVISSEGQPSTSLRASRGYHIGSCSLRAGRVGSPSFPGLGIGLLRILQWREQEWCDEVFRVCCHYTDAMLQGREAVHSQITFRRPALWRCRKGLSIWGEVSTFFFSFLFRCLLLPFGSAVLDHSRCI